jgi:SSS family solute:Na+ symporter
MHWIDWLIVVVPSIFVLGLAIYCRKYIRGVSDYVAAGRVAGRYVMCVAGLESGLGIMYLVSMTEVKYQAGFAMAFWYMMGAPVAMILGLTGFCIYRFRETKALSLGQFLEMRYNRSFRIFAASVRTLAEMLCNGIAPAIAAGFFIYFLDLPHKVTMLGFTIPTFALVVGSVLSMSVVIMWSGGRLSLLITDTIQGLLSYPIFVIIVAFVLYHFSWDTQIAPTMADRVAGESFLNPFDAKDLRDFNLFMVIAGIGLSVINRGNWLGNDGTNAGRTPHEQKMAGVLGAWRGGFSGLMALVIALAVITFMFHKDFAPQSREARIELSQKVAEAVVPDSQTRADLAERMKAIPASQHTIGIDPPYSRTQNADTPYMEAASDTFGHDSKGNDTFQSFRTAYHQMMMPLIMRHLLPTGMIGLFCLMMVTMMLATETSRMFNSSSTLIQDVVLPLHKKEMTPEQHLHWLRYGGLFVAVLFFTFSLFFRSVDFIVMFTTIVLSIWMGGAGSVILGGLYTRFGNTAGAYASIITGAVISVAAIIVQQTWAAHIYPFIDHQGWVPGISAFLEGATKHTAPYIVWKMDSVKFPINSIEISVIATLFSIVAYIAISLLTYRGAYNLDRMLHRGQYNTDGTQQVKEPWTVKLFFTKLIGLSPECTRGDKILIWSVFMYAFVYQVIICFVMVLIWNFFWPWPASWWTNYFYYTAMLVSAVVGIISTVWFMIGGFVDTRQMFRDLEHSVNNPLDDGRVKGHVSLMDVEKLGSDPEDEKPQR